MRLSTHFTLKEFTRSTTATRKGINNTPVDTIIYRGIALCEHVLEPVRTLLDNNIIRITSGYRCRTLNRKLASEDTSQHIKFEAADFIVDGYTPYEVVKAISESDIPFDQVILEFGDWVHISYTDTHKPRRNVLTICREKGKVVKKIGLHKVKEK